MCFIKPAWHQRIYGFPIRVLHLTADEDENDGQEASGLCLLCVLYRLHSAGQLADRACRHFLCARRPLHDSSLARHCRTQWRTCNWLSLIHISEPTRQAEISYAVFCLKKKKKNRNK